jgi:hypothetical protein
MKAVDKEKANKAACLNSRNEESKTIEDHPWQVKYKKLVEIVVDVTKG